MGILDILFGMDDDKLKMTYHKAVMDAKGDVSKAEKNPDVEIIAVEPKGSAVLNGGEPGPHKIQGIGGGATPPVTKVELFNEVIDVTDEDAYEYARLIPHLEGFSVGISAGAALWAAVQVAKRPENKGKNIVTIIPDNGDRYLSSDLYD